MYARDEKSILFRESSEVLIEEIKMALSFQRWTGVNGKESLGWCGRL